nr:hypothetical protein [uncultured Allomuricauda sp.]
MKEHASQERMSIIAIRVFSENNQVFRKEGKGDWEAVSFQWTSVTYK